MVGIAVRSRVSAWQDYEYSDEPRAWRGKIAWLLSMGVNHVLALVSTLGALIAIVALAISIGVAILLVFVGIGVVVFVAKLIAMALGLALVGIAKLFDRDAVSEYVDLQGY